jgi:hypothetical protein
MEGNAVQEQVGVREDLLPRYEPHETPSHCLGDEFRLELH